MMDEPLRQALQAIGNCILQLERANYMTDKYVYESINMSPNTYEDLKGASINS